MAHGRACLCCEIAFFGAEWSDVRLVVECADGAAVERPAHRLLLAHASAFLGALLRSPMTGRPSDAHADTFGDAAADVRVVRVRHDTTDASTVSLFLDMLADATLGGRDRVDRRGRDVPGGTEARCRLLADLMRLCDAWLADRLACQFPWVIRSLADGAPARCVAALLATTRGSPYVGEYGTEVLWMQSWLAMHALGRAEARAAVLSLDADDFAAVARSRWLVAAREADVVRLIDDWVRDDPEARGSRRDGLRATCVRAEPCAVPRAPPGMRERASCAVRGRCFRVPVDAAFLYRRSYARAHTVVPVRTDDAVVCYHVSIGAKFVLPCYDQLADAFRYEVIVGGPFLLDEDTCVRLGKASRDDDGLDCIRCWHRPVPGVRFGMVLVAAPKGVPDACDRHVTHQLLHDYDPEYCRHRCELDSLLSYTHPCPCTRSSSGDPATGDGACGDTAASADVPALQWHDKDVLRPRWSAVGSSSSMTQTVDSARHTYLSLQGAQSLPDQILVYMTTDRAGDECGPGSLMEEVD